MLAPRVDNLVFLVCDDDVQGGLAAGMAAPAAVVRSVLRAPGIRAQFYSLYTYIVM